MSGSTKYKRKRSFQKAALGIGIPVLVDAGVLAFAMSSRQWIDVQYHGKIGPCGMIFCDDFLTFGTIMSFVLEVAGVACQIVWACLMVAAFFASSRWAARLCRFGARRLSPVAVFLTILGVIFWTAYVAISYDGMKFEWIYWPYFTAWVTGIGLPLVFCVTAFYFADPGESAKERRRLLTETVNSHLTYTTATTAVVSGSTGITFARGSGSTPSDIVPPEEWGKYKPAEPPRFYKPSRSRQDLEADADAGSLHSLTSLGSGGSALVGSRSPISVGGNSAGDAPTTLTGNVPL